MVFVKVRETYDLKTVKNKMTVIGIHTPKPDILKRNYPGLLMQCKAYRPVSCDVRVACASMLPLDPLGVGTDAGSVAPEDVFNPILYKAMSNFGMSQLEARINAMAIDTTVTPDIQGNAAFVDVDSLTSQSDEFNLYYALLSETHSWKHANVQAGLSMTGLKPLVWEMLYSVGDNGLEDHDSLNAVDGNFAFPDADGTKSRGVVKALRGNPKPFPFINTTIYTYDETSKVNIGEAQAGFYGSDMPWNAECDVPYIPVVVGALIIPPSKLHSLFFRMVVEWTIEFSKIRSLSDIVNFAGLATGIGSKEHYQNYSYESTKEAVTGSSESILTKDSCMVSANVDVDKVM